MNIATADLLAPFRSALGLLPPPLARARYEVQLLVGRRLWLVVVLDLLLLFNGMINAFAASTGFDQASTLYWQMVILPDILLAVPVLSALIALERQSGSLDLALATSSVERYLMRRASPIVTWLALQGAVLVWLIPADFLPRLGATVFALALPVLISAVMLFWSVRLRTSGAVLVSAAATLLLLGPWIGYHPFPSSESVLTLDPERFAGIPLALLSFVFNLLVILGVSLLLLLYARWRLRRPETLL